MKQLSNDFDPTPFPGLTPTIISSIESTDVDLRKELYGSIVVSGGNTMFQGYMNRMTKEIQTAVQAVRRIQKHLRCTCSGIFP